MNYIFLDTESTGASTVWDQVLEIGMVWTDENLNIKEKWEMRSRIKDGIVPNLGACEVTGFSVQDLTQSNHSHLQMVEAMENTLKRWGNAYVFAYNGQNFDYPLIQKTLYKSLKPAYITNTNGKKHGDVLNIIRAAKLINPESINISTTVDTNKNINVSGRTDLDNLLSLDMSAVHLLDTSCISTSCA